jgi:dipeptidyl-peptidase-4
MPSDSRFPRQLARTRRFTLGVPGRFTIAPDGSRVVFVRTRGGTDPVACLWTLDVAAGDERLVVDPRSLVDDGAEVPEEEKVRRERARDHTEGIGVHATDGAVRRVVFALAGRLWTTGMDGGPEEVPVAGPALDPRFDAAGRHIAYVARGGLRVVGADGTGDRALAEPEGPKVTYGLPEHVAAEGMGRARGHWWAPGGERLLVARVDNTRVHTWHIADPSDPAAPPKAVAYPAVGTPNADVTLWILALDGTRAPVEWDRAAYEYVVAVDWSAAEPLVVVQSRDQRRVRVLRVDPRDGTTSVAREDRDADWVHVVPGSGRPTASGALVWVVDDRVTDTRRLVVGDALVTPPGLQVRAVLDVDGDTILFSASEEPTEVHVWVYDGAPSRLTNEPGVHTAQRSGGTTVLESCTATRHGTAVTVLRDGRRVPIASLAEEPILTPRSESFAAGERGLRTAVYLPSWHVPGSAKLPVLLCPYGGQGLQVVLAARDWPTLVAQWYAEQGYAVVIADGRGTPGRGPAWDRSVRGDVATPVLQDQVDALHEAAARHPDLDLDRVGIRGWSFGGFLAALAVLRRPDVFHAAVAGAPVTDHRLYDTYWKERVLGHPDEEPENYERCSLIGDAPGLRRPLLFVHGLADDNVVVAHTLRMSAALMAAGRPHEMLLLPGVTHAPRGEATVTRLMETEAAFLRRALGVDTGA